MKRIFCCFGAGKFIFILLFVVIYFFVGARSSRPAYASETTVYLGPIEKTIETGEIKVYIPAGNAVIVKSSTGITSTTGSTSYLYADHLGSTSLVTDELGNKTETNLYYPYGNQYPENPQPVTRNPLTNKLYTGQRLDSSSDLYFYNARYYNPNIGNFISADMASKYSNKYNYVINNPMRYFDVSGNDPVDSLALYLCQSELSDCSNLDPWTWGGVGENGAANRALNIAETTRRAQELGFMNLTLAGNRIISDEEIEEVGGGLNIDYNGGLLGDFRYDLKSLNRAKVTGINYALIVAISGQEGAFAQSREPNYLIDILNAHAGSFFASREERGLWHSEKIYKEKQEYSIFLEADILGLIYSARMFAGYNQESMEKPGKSYPAFLANGNLNPVVWASYGSGFYDPEGLWMRKVQGYYNAIVSFANEYSNEYGWLLENLTPLARTKKTKTYIAE